ncbi:TBCD protein [Dentipellis sp. KUC8613]|nr:TBCD protein [Dentipellis sp. KUC8613]
MEDSTEGRILARFDKHEEFTELQNQILSLDISVEPTDEEQRNEALLVQKISNILDEYQEQSFLLDPFLEELVVPVVNKLKGRARTMVSNHESLGPTTRLSQISLILYLYVKLRGYKTIIRFFPHEIADLSIAIEFAQKLEAVQDRQIWSLVYVTLLWLSLICMIPFDLSQFDEVEASGKTALAVEMLARSHLNKAGLEREGAAILLSRLFVRKDTHDRLDAFLEWSHAGLTSNHEVFQALGVAKTLCEVAKISPADLISTQILSFLDIAQLIDQNSFLMGNAVMRKLRMKLISRSALRLLPARPRGGSEEDVPEEIETILQEIFHALEDKDTIVRWSAAKGVASVAERLPADFDEQVLETVMGLFSIHSIAVASLYDMPTVAESTWHGASLACAEMARRGLVRDDKLKELIDWMSKALYFDIRKGAHSIGSNVRDAAAYVLWSLARTHETPALQPFAKDLARNLVSVSVYDREVQIRRAASAAFQEYVGRTGVFPDGIDVLRKTDFFAVGVRRNAFLVAAPEVAEHTEYRQILLDHLLNVIVRHWDPAMRQLGAESLRKICELDLLRLANESAERLRTLVKAIEPSDIHGALVALTELACACREGNSAELELLRQKIFTFLGQASLDMIQSPRNELVTAAACNLIASSISLPEIQLVARSSVPHWRKIIDIGLKHRNPKVQDAAANAMAEVSKLVDCSDVTGTPTMQQSLGRFLGKLDYSAFPHGLSGAIECLLDSVNNTSPTRMMNIEARRNCYESLPQIIRTVVPQLTTLLQPETLQRMFKALLAGLDDYTVDERGDVGSWVRMACIDGLTEVSLTLLNHSTYIPNFSEYLPANKYHAAISGIVKQGVERLDNVRHEAGTHLLRLLNQTPPSDEWQIRREDVNETSDISGWQNSSWLFPRAVRLLEIPEYRSAVLSGLLLSISSKTDSTQRPVSSSFVAYVRGLPVATIAEGAYDIRTLAQNLLEHARGNLQANTTVIPVLQAFNILLEADTLDALQDDLEGLQSLRRLFAIASRNVPKLKNVHRIGASMKIVVNLLTLPKMHEACLERLTDFLTHQYPRVRADTAEYLYLVLQSKDVGKETEEAEEVLLDAEWCVTIS